MRSQTAGSKGETLKTASVKPSVQVALRDQEFSRRLRGALSEEPAFLGWPVECCLGVPDVTKPGVIILDTAALARLGNEIPYPERVVLIAPRDPLELTRAWEVGIISVVYDDEPLNTAMLAAMAARFRAVRHPP